MAGNEISRALLSLAIAALLVFGLLYHFFGPPLSLPFGSGPESDAKQLCARDFACAEKQATELGALTAQSELGSYSRALGAAYRRKDCAFARELLDGAGRVVVVEPKLVAARRKMAEAHAGACRDARPPPASPPPPADARIVLEHAPCGVECAAYTLTVHPDGTTEWEGKSKVATRGQATGHVSRAAAAQLFELLERARFESLEKEYLSTAPDRPIVRITLDRGSIRHSVVSDGPCTEPAAVEAGLCHLVRRIDELGGAKQFVEARDE